MGDMELQVFADRLKELRTENNLTQAQFVDGLGITASALSAYEKNLKNPSISVAKRIADKYHVSIDWLCGLSDKKSLTAKIETYRDLYEHLFLLDENNAAHMDFHVFQSEPGNLFAQYQAIHFINCDIDHFLEEWEKMRTLHINGSIDDELYELWKEKTLAKANSIISDELPFN